MPQSRHRKINKRKRERQERSATKKGPSITSSKNFKVGVLIVLAALVISLFTYFIINRPKSGNEITTASGLKYVDERVGDGPIPQKGQTVTVNYVGKLQSNDFEFDSSYKRNQPADFQIGVGRVIKAWDEALMTMKVGGKRKLIVPPELGYGKFGRPPDIPGNATLVFDVELLGVK